MLSGSWQPPTEKTKASTDELRERYVSLAPDALRGRPATAPCSRTSARETTNWETAWWVQQDSNLRPAD